MSARNKRQATAESFQVRVFLTSVCLSIVFNNCYGYNLLVVLPTKNLGRDNGFYCTNHIRVHAE